MVAVLAPACALAQTQAQPQAQEQPATSPAKPADSQAPVVVTGKAPAVIKKIDRTIYDVKDNPQAQTGSAADILATLPSVSVGSDGSVSVRGEGSVQVLIDGKPSTALKGPNRATTLQTLSGNAISRIEVITNPGAQFRSDGGAVINIITKKPGKGTSGDLVANVGLQGRYNGSLSGSYTIGKLTVNGSASIRRDGRESDSHTERTQKAVDGSPISHMREHYTGVGRRDSTVFDLGASYALSEHDTLSLSSEYARRGGGRPTIDTIILLDPNDAVTSDTTTAQTGADTIKTASLTGTYLHKGHIDGETFTLTLRHEDEEDVFDHDYLERHDLPAGPDTAYRILRTGRQLSDELSGDYVLPFGKDNQLTAGFDVETDRNQSFNTWRDVAVPSGAETADPSQTNTFLIEQTLSAAYVTYQAPVGKWVVQGGLRAENMLTRLRPDRLTPYIVTSDVQWSPSLYLSRDLSDSDKLTFSYSHRIERPDQSDLNPLPLSTGQQDVFVGNPYLKPGQVQSYEAGVTHTTQTLSYGVTAYYRQSEHTITDYSVFISDTVLRSTRENAGRGRSGGLDMSTDMKLSPKLNLSLSADVFGNELEAFVGGQHTRHDGTSYIAHGTLDYKPTTKDSIQLQVIANGRTLTSQGTQDGFRGANLAWRHQLGDRLKLVVNVSDVFNTAHFDNIIETATFRDETKYRLQGQVIYAGFTYKLGALKPGP